jgi:3-phosphoshikimate 1-carboxyvinyltransferase
MVGEAVTMPVRIAIPGDKSISHRALIFASFAEGVSALRNLLAGEDVQSTARVLRALGCTIPLVPADGAEVRVQGRGLRGWTEPGEELYCGNSGTTARLLLGALAAHPFRSVLTGDASLRSRPMRRVTEPLERAGAQFRELEQPDRLPIEVRGHSLNAFEHVSPHASAQVKSALLLAGLCAGVTVQVTEPRLSRDHTERMLRAMGVAVQTSFENAGVSALLTPGAQPAPIDITVPGDPSSAAFFLALGLAGTRPIRVEDVGLNPTRTGILAVLRRMGGLIEIESAGNAAGEPVGHLTAYPSRLHGTVVSADELPAMIDEVPILAVLASRADGETRIEGAGELRVKESDRLRALASNLTTVGVSVDELPDGLIVRGSRAAPNGRVRAFHDHRIAMAFGVLGALPDAHVEVDAPDVAAVSFPDFWERLGEAAGRA